MGNGDRNLCVALRLAPESPCHTLTLLSSPFGNPYGFGDCCFVLQPFSPSPPPPGGC